jgi:hypothetical protein
VTTTEDRLRDAFRADAETIEPGTLRPAPARPDRPGAYPRARRLPGWPGWLGSRMAISAVAAAAAVTAIAVAAAVAGNSGGPPPGGLSPLGTPAPPAPRYLISLSRTSLVVYKAATGRRVGVIPGPGHGASFVAAVATAPGRFVVAIGRAQACTSRLYRLTLTKRGRLDRLTPLPGGRVGGMLSSSSALAASASGRVIGYAASHCTGKPGWVGVLRPATGQTRRWSLKSEGLLSLAMAPGGQLLYFDYTTVFGGDGTIRVLRTAAPSGPMTARARVILPASSGTDIGGSIALAGGGKTLLACQEVQHTAVLVAYSAATGGELGVLHTWHNVDVAPCTLTAASSGGYLLITDIGAHPWRMQLSSGRARQLPIGRDDDPVESVAW